MNFGREVTSIEEMIYSDERVKRLLHGYLLDKEIFWPEPRKRGPAIAGPLSIQSTISTETLTPVRCA